MITAMIAVKSTAPAAVSFAILASGFLSSVTRSTTAPLPYSQVPVRSPFQKEDRYTIPSVLILQMFQLLLQESLQGNESSYSSLLKSLSRFLQRHSQKLLNKGCFRFFIRILLSDSYHRSSNKSNIYDATSDSLSKEVFSYYYQKNTRISESHNHTTYLQASTILFTYSATYGTQSFPYFSHNLTIALPTIAPSALLTHLRRLLWSGIRIRPPTEYHFPLLRASPLLRYPS